MQHLLNVLSGNVICKHPSNTCFVHTKSKVIALRLDFSQGIRTNKGTNFQIHSILSPASEFCPWWTLSIMLLLLLFRIYSISIINQITISIALKMYLNDEMVTQTVHLLSNSVTLSRNIGMEPFRQEKLRDCILMLRLTGAKLTFLAAKLYSS